MPSTAKTTSQVIAQFVRLARRERLRDDELGYVCQRARKKRSLNKPPRARKLLHPLTTDE